MQTSASASSRTRYLPPGTMRKQRRRGRIEGSVATLLATSAIGAALVAMTPLEIYRAARPTRDGERGTAMHFAHAPLPPCTDRQAKDCMAMEDPEVRTIPEPGTMALIGTALVGMMVQRARK